MAKAVKKKSTNKAVVPTKRTTLPAVLPQPRSMLELIAMAARDPAIDVGKMKELLSIKREEEARQAEIIFNEAMRDAEEEMPPIMKNAKGAHDITYATLEKVSRTIDPIARKYGFSFSYGMADSPIDHHYRITARLRHRAGHSENYFVDLPADTTGPRGGGNKNPTQGVGSTISYGRRYLKMMIFNLVVTGEDNDGVGVVAEVEKINKDQLKAISDAIKFTDTKDADFCAHFKIERVEDLPKPQFQTAMNILQRKANR